MPTLEVSRTKIKDYKKTEEYYNSIRTNIQFSGNNIKTIVISSVEPGEGKSTTSANLAITFARGGFKTLLIDADTRNSVMSGTFKANERIKGLTAYLSGNAELNEAICTTTVENLYVLPAGQVPPNPTSLLQNTNFKYLLDYTREWYDVIIIDSPPIGLVVDAAIIAKQCDASLMVTEPGRIRRRFLGRAVDQMTQSGCQFLGVILNKVDNKLDSYGAYGGYGVYGEYGAYGNYGKYSEQKKKREKKRKKRVLGKKEK